MTLPKPKARAPTCWHGQQQLQRNNNTTTTHQQHNNNKDDEVNWFLRMLLLLFVFLVFCFFFALCTYIHSNYICMCVCLHAAKAPPVVQSWLNRCVSVSVCVCVLQLVVCTWPQTFLQHVGNTVRNNLHTLAMDTHICIQMIMIKLQFDGKCLNTLQNLVTNLKRTWQSNLFRCMNVCIYICMHVCVYICP